MWGICSVSWFDFGCFVLIPINREVDLELIEIDGYTRGYGGFMRIDIKLKALKPSKKKKSNDYIKTCL